MDTKKIILFAVLITGVCFAQNFDAVPGVVINYIQSPTRVFGFPWRPVYISDPCIVVLDNGDYIASHARFGSGSNSTDFGETSVFRSTDKGQSWTYITTLNGILRASLFVHNGDLYLLGAEAEGKPNVIRKSTDNGDTWTQATSDTTGLLGHGGLGTPNNPVVANGRIWSGATRRLFSAPVNSDLLKASSWSITNNPSNQGHPFGSAWEGWTEGQAVVAPWSTVYVLPKIRALPHTALIRATSATNVVFNASAPNAFPSLPGGEKKFGATLDPVSNKFYVLSNPVIAAHAGTSTPPELVRTTAAVLTSKDLVNWDVEKFFLFTENLDNGSFGEGFQYFNFDFDGDDIVVASRTAFDVGGGQRRPPRGHDSNLMTFHRIENFRNLSPEHILVLNQSQNQVLRYELTQHQNAPLGSFNLGSSFDGAALNEPNGFGQDDNGDVYISEAGGRILRFCALGNFIETVSQAPVDLQTEDLAINQPAHGRRTWTESGSGDWHILTNWYYWGRPDTDYEIAVMGSAITSPATISLNQAYTFKGIEFSNENSYTLDGTGNITIKSDTNLSKITSKKGSHEINVPMSLQSDTELSVLQGASLTFDAAFNLFGKDLSITGEEKVKFQSQFILNSGSVTFDGRAPISFAQSANVTPNGKLRFIPHESIRLRARKTFTLFEGANRINGTFSSIELPDLEDGLIWDTSMLYTQGNITIVPDPENNDYSNFAHLSYWWLSDDCHQQPGCHYADLNDDGWVSLADLILLVDNWLNFTL